MATTNFVDQSTIIQAEWLNDVDALVYDMFGSLNTPEEILNFLITDNTITAATTITGAVTAGDITSTGTISANTLTVTGAFTSIGIDDNATSERIQINDTAMYIGENATATGYNIFRPVQDGYMVIGGGASSALSAQVLMYGGSHATTALDLHLRAGNNSFAIWDESAGDLTISTGTGTKTQALYVGSAAKSIKIGDPANTGSVHYIGPASTARSSSLELCGGMAGDTSPSGSSIRLYGASHASLQNCIGMYEGTYTVYFYDRGTNDSHSWYVGGTTSKSVHMELNASSLILGDQVTTTDSFAIGRSANDSRLTINGGVTGAYGNITLYGTTDASRPGDLLLSSGSYAFLDWDESDGELLLKTGVGFKTTALTLSVNQTLKGLVTIVASLPSASTEGAGARAFVTDATATTFASIVAGGGANNVPVYSNGTNWLIG